jgi:polyferredoxin
MPEPSETPQPVATSAVQRFFRADVPWVLARAAAAAGMGGLLFLMWGRWGIPDVDVPDPLMYTNLGNFLFWVAFLMGLPILALFAGRAFCAVCPLGVVNEKVARFGRGRSFPRFLRNDAGKAALLLLTMALLGLARIHHWPGSTAYYLAGWLALAVLLGLFFRGRSLCSFACPIGGMLGLYARVAVPEVGVADPAVCRACESKDCVRGRETWTTAAVGRLKTALRFRRAGCPVNLKAWDVEGSGRCLLCGNCLRACPYGNAVFRVRRPLATLWRESFPRFTENATAAALLGFLLLSFARFWPGLAAALSFPGAVVLPLLGTAASRVTSILWGGFFFPALLLALPAFYTRWRIASSTDRDSIPAGEGKWGVRVWLEEKAPESVDEGGEEEGAVAQVDSVRGLMATFLPAFVPVLLAGHLILAVVKINAKGAYLPLGIFDPIGIRAYMMVEELGVTPRPGLLLPLVPLKWGLLGLLVLATACASGVALSIARREKLPAGATVVAVLATAGLVGGGFIKWLF